MSYLDQFETFLEGLVKPFQDQLADTQAHLALAQSSLDTANAQHTTDAGTITTLTAQVDGLNTTIVDLKAQIAALQQPPVAPTPGLWFQLPPDIRARNKKVFAHYFGPFPRSMDNKSPESADYYTTGYLAPGGEGGIHAATGGYLRDRPIYRAPLGITWKTDDAAFDVATAAAAGIDGFVCDILGQSGSNWDNYMALLGAADTFNKTASTPFYVIPMIDTNGNTYLQNKTNFPSAANSLAQFAGKSTSFYNSAGAFVISSFKAEGAPVSWWSGVMSALSTQIGKPVAFMASFLDASQAAVYSSVTWTEGSWGYGGDPASVKAASDLAAASHGRNKPFFAPVEGQNVRPEPSHGAMFDESANTEAERASWEKVITQNADYVQIVTWSDFSEGTQYTPSEARGYAPLDLASWYIHQWKTGSTPAILKDNVILSHRVAPIGAKPTGSQTKFMTQWSRGTRTALRDTVEALTFLTAPASVSVNVGGQITSYDAPAGMFAKTVPLGVGSVSVVINRLGSTVASLTSPAPVVARPMRDEPSYIWSSSTRGTVGQKAPYGP